MAQEESQDPFHEYLYSKFLMKELTGIDMNDDDFIEKSYLAYRGIGNIATAIHSFEAYADDNFMIKLPCNCEFVESVSTGGVLKDAYDDFLIFYDTDIEPATAITTSTSFLPDIIGDDRYRRHNLSKSELHPKGEYIPFKLEGTNGDRYIALSHQFSGIKLQVIYRGVLIDRDGNPLITMKQAEAIAMKTAFYDIQKRAFMGDPSAIQLLSYVKPEAERKMAAAKIPEYLSQNFINRLLSAKTRHDRKVFWASYKPLQ